MPGMDGVLVNGILRGIKPCFILAMGPGALRRGNRFSRHLWGIKTTGGQSANSAKSFLVGVGFSTYQTWGVGFLAYTPLPFMDKYSMSCLL